MNAELKTITPNIEDTIVEIARVSSSRSDKTGDKEKLINYLIDNKHWSPFEHGFITIEINTSRAIGTQLLRHRSFTFQEFSQRYATVVNIEGIELRKQHKNNRQSSTKVFNPIIKDTGNSADMEVQECIDMCLDTYRRLLDAGVARECARMVLPLATQTTIYMTGSVRSWIHFLAIRDESHAQKEAQDIAKRIKHIFKMHLPIISSALNY